MFDPKARSAEDFGIYLHEQIKHFRGTKLYNLNRTRPSFINATFLSGGSIHEEKTADANATVLPEVLVDRLEKSGSRAIRTQHHFFCSSKSQTQQKGFSSAPPTCWRTPKQHWQIPENFCWWFLIN